MFSRKSRSQKHRGAVRKAGPRLKINRRHLFTAATLIAILTVSLVLVWQLHDYEPETLLPIEHVALEGNFKNLTSEAMQARVVDVLEGGYFTVNLATIRTALLEMPWVEEVSIRRQWPAALQIRVSEKQAVAYWGSDSLISDKGELFTPPVISHQARLPQLNGPDLLHKKVWEFALRVSTDLAELGLQTEKVSLDERRAWRVYVARNKSDESARDNLIEINFGSADTEQRLQRFVTVFAMHKTPDLTSVQVIDMRYPNGFALRTNNNKERGV